jgi:hypothetical protein
MSSGYAKQNYKRNKTAYFLLPFLHKLDLSYVHWKDLGGHIKKEVILLLGVC